MENPDEHPAGVNAGEIKKKAVETAGAETLRERPLQAASTSRDVKM